MRRKILEQAQKAHRLRKQILKQFVHDLNKHRSPSCNTCTKDYCCYQMVSISVFEAVIIADWIQRNRRFDILAELRQQAYDQKELFNQRGDYNLLNIVKFQDAVSNAWFDQQRPCPFLDNGRCLIYPIRPITCSSHFVVSPPERCAPPTGSCVGKVNVEKVFVYGFQLDAAFLNIVGAKHTQFMPSYMGIMVDIALDLLENGIDVLGDHALLLTLTLEETDDRRLVREEIERRSREHPRPYVAECNPQSVGELEGPPDTSK